MRLLPLALVPLAALLLAGCGLAERAAVSTVYDRADLPASQTFRDLPYRDGAGPKQRLNLFVPDDTTAAASGWPTVVFVHGGGWTSGDRDYELGGADFYNNIGRFLAARGIGAAVVSYRLQPAVDWRAQEADVADAVAWVHREIGGYGGDPEALFLMGHSAGAHLSARVALGETLPERGVSRDIVCGVIPVSGAALDLTDRETYALGGDYDYYARRFGPWSGRPVTREELPSEPPVEPAPWEAEASVVPLVTPGAPPFLLLYAGGDYTELIRQAEVLAASLQEAGVPHETVVVPGRSHTRIVPTLSRDDQTAGPAILDFVRSTRCD